MSKKYVPEGVYLACNKGTCSSQLRVSNNEKTTIYGAAMATEADKFPYFNLKPMGFCTDPFKIIGSGVMCISTILKWENPKEGIVINGNKMLLEDSTCKCILGGGDISIHFDIASANQIALWGGAKMPTEYIKEGFDWAFADMAADRAIRDANAPDWMQGIDHGFDWFDDLSLALVEGAVTGVVGLGEVIYQVAQDPVAMGGAVGDMFVKADAWVEQKDREADIWVRDPENWSNAADSIWKTTTETDWIQATKDGASATWEGTKDAGSWVADNPRKIGVTVGEFIPDAVAAAYTGGASVAVTGAKKVGKEIAGEIVEEVIEEAIEKVAKETIEEVAEATGKKVLKEGVEAASKKTDVSIAKVVAKIKPKKPKPPFKKNPKHKSVDFNKQLTDQQDAINKMTIKDWLKNRKDFANRNIKEYNKKAKKARDAYRKKIKQSKYNEYRRKGLSHEDATKKANEYMKGKAALHNPDGIAGGNVNQITAMGDSKVNSSLGSQWKNRGKSIEDQIKIDYGIPPKTIDDVPAGDMMNIDLF